MTSSIADTDPFDDGSEVGADFDPREPLMPRTAAEPLDVGRPPWPDLQPGERVTLTIDARVTHPIKDGTVAFLVDAATEGGHPNFFDAARDHPRVRVARAAPVEGIPEIGELWTDKTGRIYFAVQAWSGEKPADPRLATGKGSPVLWREVHTGPDGPIRRLMTADEIARLR